MAGTKPPTPETQLTAEQKTDLINAAKAALTNAYAPYSKFRVGAAVLTDSGAVYRGCNIENASYGLAICAERTAVFRAVYEEGGKMRIRAIAVWSEPEIPCSPCGACRQVIFEFGTDAVVLFQGKDGVQELSASDLLPAGFRF